MGTHESSNFDKILLQKILFSFGIGNNSIKRKLTEREQK